MGNSASDELLFNATKSGDLEKVKELISNGARTEFRDKKVSKLFILLIILLLIMMMMMMMMMLVMLSVEG